MGMPKLGSSLSAMVPAPGAKFGAKWLDKWLNLERPFVRTQEYAPVATAAVAFGMVYTDTYPEEATGLWHGSLSMIGDELLSWFFDRVDPPSSGNPGSQSTSITNTKSTGNPGNNKNSNAVEEARKLLEAARAKGVELPIQLVGSIPA